MSVAGTALAVTLAVFFGSFVFLMLLMDCLQPAKADGRPKNHCWQCNKKGTSVLTEGTKEYDAFMKKRAEASQQQQGGQGQGQRQHVAHAESDHFAIHDSDEEEDDHQGDDLNSLLR
jgi:hypothetical protein